MSPTAKTPVAFAFVNDGSDWHGGLNYFRSLFLALESRSDSVVRPIAFIGCNADESVYGFPPGVKVVRDSVFDRRSVRWTLNKLATKLFGVPWLSNKAALDQGAHVLSHGVPTGSASLRSIAWIPDFQHLHLPQFFPEKELATRNKVYRALIEQSSLVVVSSESARRDLEKFAPEFSSKARVLRFCAMQPTLDQAAAIDVASVYRIPGRYFYMPNQVWAHKNHLTAIRALADVVKTNPDVRVICSGSLSDYRNPGHLDTLKAEIAALGVTDQFILLGLVPYAHIAQLMQQSVAVINPSLFEGWSTTVEEAKALAVPLLLSNIDVHREQCSRGEALFFDPLEPAALADAMRTMLAASKGRRLQNAAELRRRHDARVTEFALAYEHIIAELDSPKTAHLVADQSKEANNLKDAP